jgi:hypothetical protein
MQKSNSLKPVHKHVLTSALVLAITCLFAFVIYPKMVLPARGGGGGRDISATPGNGQVELIWTELNVTVVGEEGEVTAPASNYRIDYSASELPLEDERSSGTVYTGDSSTSYTVNDLANDIAYTFIVTGLEGDIESDRSRSVTATPTRGKGGEGDIEVDVDPIVFSEEPMVNTTANSATITWSTNISASSQVVYGPTEDFSGNTPEYNTLERATGHSVEITGLASCVGYWYKAVSYDAEGNFAESAGGEFKTTGCKGDSEIVTYQAASATTLAGATVEAKVGGRGIRAVAPANLKSGITEVGVEALKLQKSSVEPVISKPTGKEWIGEAYSLKAFEDEKTELEDNFDAPVEVTIDYTAEDVSGLDPASLRIYHYTDGIGWEVLSNCINDTEEMKVTCETTSFSIFGLFGSAESGASPQTQSGSHSSINQHQNNQVVKTTPQAPTVNPISNTSIKFQKNLGLGQKDADVRSLQVFLNNAGFAVAIAGSGSAGYETDFFGPLTFKALVKFQEAYQQEILAPYGLTKGTGFFGEKTRAFINSMQ